MNRLQLPGSSEYVTDGAIIVISQFGTTRWIAHYGWYTYKSQQSLGWYATSIPNQTVVPLVDSTLIGVSIISSNGSCGCNSQPSCCPPTPPCPPVPPFPPVPPCPPPGPEFSVEDKWELARAALSVNTIAERDKLGTNPLLPHGKLVRVNECPDGKSHYYVWNQITQQWDEETFGAAGDISQMVKDEVSDQLADLDIDKKISDAIDDKDIPKLIDDAITNNKQLESTVTDIAQRVVPPIVDAKLEDINQSITNLTEITNEIQKGAGWEPIVKSASEP